MSRHPRLPGAPQRAAAMLLLAAASGALSAVPPAALPDFRVTDILVLNDRFLAIKMENVSAAGCPPAARQLDGVMLTLYINGIRRAEFKASYLDPLLFKPRSHVLLRTNFRIGGPLVIRAEINPDRLCAEAQTANNTLEKAVE